MATRITGTNTAAAPGITGDDTDTGLFYGTNEIGFSTGGTSRATIDSSGRLLIGTTTEGNTSADNLTISDTTTGITLRSGTSDQGSIYFSDATSGAGEYAGYMRYDHSGNNIAFGTSSTERLRVASAGQIGIGGANYGTDGQVLTSTGASSAPAWEDAGGKINKYQVSKITTVGTLSNPASTLTVIPNSEVSYTPTTASSYLVVRCHTMLYCTPGSTSNGGEEMYPRVAMVMNEINGSATTIANEKMFDLSMHTNVEHDPGSDYIKLSFPCSYVARLDVNGKSWSSGAIKFCLAATSGWNYPLYIAVNSYSQTVWEITEYSE